MISIEGMMAEESQKQKPSSLVIWIIVVISLLYLGVFWFPNSAASDDIGMVSVFEPDEAMPLPYLLDMIDPPESLYEGVKDFVAYGYYYYGFPYFAYSAISILPAKLSGPAEAQIPLVMVLLRQMVSVLPILLAIILLVYMQTGFRSLPRTVSLFMILLAVPAVISNNFWWHPDGLSILFIVLTIFFLYRDDLSFGKDFFLAAFLCGFTTGVKLNGLFFVLTIAVYLLWGLLTKKIDLKKAVLLGAAFIVLMFVGFIISNPELLLSGPREQYLRIMSKVRKDLSHGFNVLYPKGIRANGPLLTTDFGSWVYLALAVAAPVVGIIRNRNRLLHVIILTWSLVIGVYVLFFSIVKFQYVLPFAIPLFSSCIVYFPGLEEIRTTFSGGGSLAKLWQILALAATAVIAVQFFSHVQSDISQIVERTQRLENSLSVQFYAQAENHLAPLIGEDVVAYRDVRVYVPDDSSWTILLEFDLLTYAYFQENHPGVILLRNQRIRDYLNPNVTGIDAEKLEISREFYRDAEEGTIDGYTLVFRDEYGSAFVRDELYRQYFGQ